MCSSDLVAIGPLDGDGCVDRHACERMLQVARGHGLSVSFLRTFDLLVDRDRGMRDVVQLGFDRLLIGGVLGWDASVKPLAERMAEVARTIEVGRAEAARLGRTPIEVMPCGGVRASNAAQWLAITPHLHASCRRGEIGRAHV